MREQTHRYLSVMIEPADAGRRLDAVVARHAGVSVHAARRVLAAGGVRCNGRVCAAGEKGRRLGTGEVVQIAREAIDPLPVPRPDLPLDVLATGAGYVAVNKPPGVGTHPLDPSQTDTVLNRVVARCPEVAGVGEGGLRSGVVHRLDLPTTGVLLFATTDARFAELRAAFTRHAIRKTYLALIRGRVREAGRQTMHLAVTRHRPARVEAVGSDHPGARACSLSWRVQQAWHDASLVEVELETGFLHQVRAMFAAMGRPLLGDGDYGDGGGGGAPRVMLHAAALSYEDIEVRCDPPADFLAACASRRGSRPPGA